MPSVMMLNTSNGTRTATIVIWFLLGLFVLLNMAVLVLELGLARLVQSQMQAAADASSLEGIRFRDDIPMDLLEQMKAGDPLAFADLEASCGPVNPNADTWRQIARRWFVSHFVSVHACGPLEPLHSIGNHQFVMVGPNHPNAQQFYPDLQLNRLDQPRDPIHKIFPDMEVVDDSFVVRIHRSDDRSDRVAGIASAGPPLTTFFGKASRLFGLMPSESFTLRAQSRATSRPAVWVGPAYPGTMYQHTNDSRLSRFIGLPGLAPFALALEFWNAQSIQSPTECLFEPTGAIRVEGNHVGQIIQLISLRESIRANNTMLRLNQTIKLPPVPFAIRLNQEILQVHTYQGNTLRVRRGHQGTVPEDHPAGTVGNVHMGLSIGLPVSQLATPRPETWWKAVDTAMRSFIAIYHDDHIVGFGRISWTPLQSHRILIRKLPEAVASSNVSAVIPVNSQALDREGFVMPSHRRVDQAVRAVILGRDNQRF